MRFGASPNTGLTATSNLALTESLSDAFSIVTDRPVDGGLSITYLVRIGLNGSLPRAIVDKVASEIPLCTGRARDVYTDSEH